MTHSITIRGKSFGDSKPLVCVPITGHDKAQIQDELNLIRRSGCDAVEWRADYYGLSDYDTVTKIIRSALDCPVIYTLRSSSEGGQKVFEEQARQICILQMIDSRQIDLADIELNSDRSFISQATALSKRRDVKIILSNHDFERTPPLDDIISRLERMWEYGADIAKVAYMPQSAADVLTLLAAANQFREKRPIPLIAISMGAPGMISRIGGGFFGSCLTFASSFYGKSAPGQLNAAVLIDILKHIY